MAMARFSSSRRPEAHPTIVRRNPLGTSITGRCKALKIRPFDDLTRVLPRLPAVAGGHVDGLLPHDYATSLADAHCSRRS